jgi:RNA polymerase sigma-70 factor (ECF subfamily)
VAAQKRSVTREDPFDLDLADESVMELANRFVASATSASRRLEREERGERVRHALARLKPQDREVLVLRYLEQLSTSEATAVLGISQAAFTKRHLRAIQRLRGILDQEFSGGAV